MNLKLDLIIMPSGDLSFDVHRSNEKDEIWYELQRLPTIYLFVIHGLISDYFGVLGNPSRQPVHHFNDHIRILYEVPLAQDEQDLAQDYNGAVKDHDAPSLLLQTYALEAERQLDVKEHTCDDEKAPVDQRSAVELHQSIEGQECHEDDDASLEVVDELKDLVHGWVPVLEVGARLLEASLDLGVAEENLDEILNAPNEKHVPLRSDETVLKVQAISIMIRCLDPDHSEQLVKVLRNTLLVQERVDVLGHQEESRINYQQSCEEHLLVRKAQQSNEDKQECNVVQIYFPEARDQYTNEKSEFDKRVREKKEIE